RLEMEGGALLDELFQAYLRQALVVGLVHADPHPGNVFLTDDGRVALIDVGQVLHIPDRMRERLRQVLIAIGEGKGEDAARTIERMGEPTPQFQRRAFERDVARLVGRATEPGQSKQLKMGFAVVSLARIAADNGLQPPTELSLIGKT